MWRSAAAANGVCMAWQTLVHFKSEIWTIILKPNFQKPPEAAGKVTLPNGIQKQLIKATRDLEMRILKRQGIKGSVKNQ